MRLLVTGGAGFIGSHFVRTVLGTGYAGLEGAIVTVLDKFTYAGNAANLSMAASSRLDVRRGDICDAALLAEVLPGHDAVVHFAAESHVDRSIAHAADFVMTNVVGTQTLLDACLRAKVERVVHVSTDEVYGSIVDGAWSEGSPLEPNSPYSASKGGSDLFARAYHRTYGLPVVITRCSNNYGPFQHPEKVVPLFVTNLLDGLAVPLYGDGHNVREWLHVDDHCRAIALTLTSGIPGEIYNVGGGSQLDNLELTRRILAAMGASWDSVRSVEDRKGHDDRYSIDGSKLATLGYRPTYDFDKGLAETIEWYRTHETWWRPLVNR